MDFKIVKKRVKTIRGLEYRLRVVDGKRGINGPVYENVGKIKYIKIGEEIRKIVIFKEERIGEWITKGVKFTKEIEGYVYKGLKEWKN